MQCIWQAGFELQLYSNVAHQILPNTTLNGRIRTSEYAAPVHVTLTQHTLQIEAVNELLVLEETACSLTLQQGKAQEGLKTSVLKVGSNVLRGGLQAVEQCCCLSTCIC